MYHFQLNLLDKINIVSVLKQHIKRQNRLKSEEDSNTDNAGSSFNIERNESTHVLRKQFQNNKQDEHYRQIRIYFCCIFYLFY